MLHNLALASKLGFVCFLLAVAVRAAVPLEHQGLPSPLHALDDPLMDFDFVNTTRKRDSNQFIMTGYQSTFFRSGDCNISIPGTNEPYTYALFLPLQWRLNFTSPMPIDSKDRFTWIWTCYGPRFGDWRLTVVNWYAMYWAFEGKNLEKMHMVIEAETRGWVGVAFGGSASTDSAPAEAVFGWIQKGDSGPSHDVSHIGSHLLSSDWEGIMNAANDNTKKVPLESASVCQTRDGRTILRFTRKSHAGNHPIRTTSGAYQIIHMAVGREDGPSSPLEVTRLSWSPMQSRVDTDTESDYWTRVYQAILIIFHVFSWFIR